MKVNNVKKGVLIFTIILMLGSSIDITVCNPQNGLIFNNKQGQQIGEYDYWVQTTDEDFNNGIKYNINVSRDAFHLEEKLVTINQTILGPESFEGSWPPDGWFVTGDWNKEKDRAHSGNYSADCDGTLLGSSGTLVSLSMDTSDSSVSAIYVEFWTFSEDADVEEYYLEYFDGLNWDFITRLDNIGQGYWAQYTEKITDSKYFTSNFRIRWTVNSLDINEHVYLDDVIITLERKEVEGYETNGSLISQAHDTEQWQPEFQELIIESIIPTGTLLESWIRAAGSEPGLQEATWYSDITQVPNKRWVQWRINLTGDQLQTPTVFEVNLTWYYEEFPLPEETFVDDDYDDTTPGWGYDHFDNIQDGVDAVNISGTVNIYEGSYYENVIIDRSMTLIGENELTTIVDGNSIGSVFSITNSIVSVSGLKIQHSGSELTNAGICVDSAKVELTSLIIQNNQNGIILISTENCEIYLNNIIDNSNSGISLEVNSNNNWIAGNKINNNYIGIHLNIALGNEISDYNYGKIEIWNEFKNNDYGIFASGACQNNNIYHNNFLENNKNAFDQGINNWDDGEYGNYWDDYNGTDDDGDGIGDTPYTISGGNNKDNYPLMIPNGVDLEPPEVYISKPKDGYVYVNILDILVFGIPLRILFFNVLIIGKITIEVDAFDSISGINRVEIYIDNELRGTVDNAPYRWVWDDIAVFFPYTISVVAYDNAGNQNSDTRKVWKIG